MNPAANQRVAPNRVMLIFALLLAAWLVFEFYPHRKPVPPLTPMAAESKLNAVGLTNNPDWDGLPAFFSIAEKRAEWKDGRTRFAYWHPVMKTYSYYFEVTRDGAGFRFKEIAEPDDPDHYWEESPAEDSRIRFYYAFPVAIQPRPAISPEEGYPDVPAKINIDTKIPRLPPPERKIILEDRGKKS